MTAPDITVGAEPVRITIFPNYAARTKREEAICLSGLANLIITTNAAAKTALPWLKLGTFGDLRSDKGSLRNNANVLTITGIEADYDAEIISFDVARDTLLKPGVTAILYTSPSHSDAAPRWRVLCRFSKPMPPEQRDLYMARLNGLFGGIFARESWTLSQSYYFGSVNHNPNHRVELVLGTPIDLLVELDATAIGRRDTKTGNGRANERPVGSAGGSYIPVSDVRLEGYRLSVLDNLRRKAVDGDKHHALLRAALALGGIQAVAGFIDAHAIQWLMDTLPASVVDWNAAKQTAAWGLEQGRQKPLDLADRPWSGNGRHAPPTPDDADYGSVRREEPQAKPPEAPHGPEAHPEPPPPNGEDNYRTQEEQPRQSEPPPHPGRNRQRSADPGEFVWPAPLDFLSDPNREAPELLAEHIPLAINDFVFDTAERMGVDPTSVALACIVSLAAVASDDWKVQPKRYDDTWTENPRLWGAILGDPSIKKTRVINACTRPIDKLDTDARRHYAKAMREYKFQMKASKADKSGETPEPTHPKLDRYLVENTTTEALSEILREDDEAHQRAPARKVLCRHDEMSEFFANLDRYRSGGNGGGDRGAYLRLYNGGPYSADRIGRGSFAVPNWSAGYLGGMQPGPIQDIAKKATEDGLLQRFLYAVPGPQARGSDRKPWTAAQDQYNALFRPLAGLHPRRTADGKHIQVVVFHDDAHQHREAVDRRAEVMALMPDTSPHLMSAYGKWPGLFARIALTFHLIELADAKVKAILADADADADADAEAVLAAEVDAKLEAEDAASPYPLVISEQTARRAAAFMLDIALPHLLRAHRLMFSTTQTGHAQWIAGYILAEGLEWITSRDVVRAYGSLRSPEAKDELAAVMGSLVTIGWLEPKVPTNPAKPVSAWMVNPAVHVRFADRAEREKARRDKAKATIAAYAAQAEPQAGRPR